MLMQLSSAWKEKAFFIIEFIKGTESTSLIPKYLKLAFRHDINQALSATSVAASNYTWDIMDLTVFLVILHQL